MTNTFDYVGQAKILQDQWMPKLVGKTIYDIHVHPSLNDLERFFVSITLCSEGEILGLCIPAEHFGAFGGPRGVQSSEGENLKGVSDA